MKDFQKNSIVMIMLTTLASGVNYMCQIALGHVMSFASFGVMNTLFSLILVLSVPGASVNMITAKKIAQCRGNSDISCAILTRMRHFSSKIAVVILLGTTVLSMPLGNLLGAAPILLILTGAAVTTGLFPYIISGTLTGQGSFLHAGLFSLIVPLFKSVGIVFAMTFSSELLGQITVMVSIIVGNLFAVVLFRRIIFHRGSGDIPSHDVLPDEAKYIMAVNFIYLMFGNADIFFVTIFFGSEQAGIFSASMLFGRVLFFFTTAMVSVLLPYVSRASEQGTSLEIFRGTLFMTMGISLLGIIPINLFPAFFIQLLYGDKFLSAIPFIPFSCGVAVIVSLLNIELNYLIGVGRERIAFQHFSGAFLTLCAAVFLVHATIPILLSIIFIVLFVFFLLELPQCLHT